MSSSDRSTMKKCTLKMLLFLRGNWETLEELVQEADASRLEAIRQARELERMQKLNEAAAERSTEPSQAHPAKRGKRGR